jgi:hypothetical protein
LEERTKAVSYQFASERSELEQGRKDLKEDLEEVIEWERKATREEGKLAKKKELLDKQEVVITEFHEKLKAYNAVLEKQRDKQTVTEAALQKLQQELDDKAGKISFAEENLRAKDASLEKRATNLIRQEKDLAWTEEMWERWDKLLAEHELEAEKKEKNLEEQVRWFQARAGSPDGTGSSGFSGGRDDEEDARGSPGGASHWGPAYRRMGRRGEFGSGAAGGEPHPCVEAVSVHF